VLLAAAVGVWIVVWGGRGLWGGEVSPYFVLCWKRLKNSPFCLNLNKSSTNSVTHDGVSGFDVLDWTGEG